MEYLGFFDDLPGLEIGGSEGLLGTGSWNGAIFDLSSANLELQPATQYFAFGRLENLLAYGSGYPDENFYTALDFGEGFLFDGPVTSISAHFTVYTDSIPEPSHSMLIALSLLVPIVRRRR